MVHLTLLFLSSWEAGTLWECLSCIMSSSSSLKIMFLLQKEYLQFEEGYHIIWSTGWRKPSMADLPQVLVHSIPRSPPTCQHLFSVRAQLYAASRQEQELIRNWFRTRRQKGNYGKKGRLPPDYTWLSTRHQPDVKVWCCSVDDSILINIKLWIRFTASTAV